MTPAESERDAAEPDVEAPRAVDPGRGEPGREEPDVHSSAPRYARRFAGRVGRWMLDVQTRLLLESLNGSPVRTVLDVGGGHGQTAGPLLSAGYDVTIRASRAGADETAKRAAPGVPVSVGPLDLSDLPDDAYDAVTCFRILAHHHDVDAVIRGACRVARSVVVADYPSARSMNAAAGLLFGAKKRVEKDTRTFAVLRDGPVAELFRRAGAARVTLRRQFFFPMALHRACRSARASAAAEGAARAAGLTEAFGSPVVIAGSLRDARP